ncbi:polyphenol oxidase family protein [Ewingella americana]|uniref:Laccase domain-containing protein n=1 Tax=Ewingella americana TaxID=41202 RepID=A0A502GK94_9GAMM|nr:polyphenol oxidase family protein [Ewingella americana]TPG62717.1 laccase domain-containing protein [Ewingella americana]
MTDISALLSQIPGTYYGFGNKSALLPDVLQPFEATRPNKKQVHGVRIVDVVEPAQESGEADGFYTALPGILLTVFSADCLPVIFCRKDGKRVGVIHAGWRGLKAGIIEKMAERINQDGSTANWVASVGPSAHPCCYEVSQALVDEFLTELDLPPALMVPSPRYLNLAAIAEAKLYQLGFGSVDHAGSCTICSTVSDTSGSESYKYTSFRRNSHQRAENPAHPGISGRNQQSGIIIIPK